MSSNPSKKRRKTKLVLREGIDLEEEILNLQEETVYDQPKMKIKLSDTNERPSAPEMQPPLQFTIKVEVEEFKEEYEFTTGDEFKEEKESQEEIKSQEHEYKNPIVNDLQQTTHPDTQDIQYLPKIIGVASLITDTEEPIKNHDYYENIKPGTSLLKTILTTKSNIMSNDNSLIISKTVEDIKNNVPSDDQLLQTLADDVTECSIDSDNTKPTDNISIKLINVKEEDVYLEAELIARKSKNEIDKILAIETKNFWGRILRNNLEENPLETLLQTALTRWEMRVAKSRNTNPPLFYKCYICNVAWWYLDPFRTHLKQHNIEGLSISLEECFDECNIVAHVDTLTYMRNIPVPTNCYRCGKSYEIHKVANKNNIERLKYSCMYCNHRFHTCRALREHEGLCKKGFKFISEIHCDYCPLTFNEIRDYEAHLAYTHVVRSDIPMITPYKICGSCNGKYFIFHLHICMKRGLTISCNYCHRKFPSRQMVSLHQDMLEDNWKCPVCKLVLPKKCMKVEHMVTEHSENFTMAYRCTICTDIVLFLNEKSVKQHRYFWHFKKKFDSRRPFFEKIIVPNKFIELMIPQEEYNLGSNITGSTSNNKDHLKNIKSLQDSLKTVQKEIETPNTSETVHTNCHINCVEIEIKKEVEDVINQESVYEDVLSNMLKASSNVDENPNRPEECMIKVESTVAVCEPDLTKLDHSYGCTNSSRPIIKNNFEDVIIDNTDRDFFLKPKVLDSDCKNRKQECSSDVNVVQYMCTKCGNVYESMKRYLLHFTIHNLKCLTCPHCLEIFQSITKLIVHVNSVIKHNFTKLQLIDHSNMDSLFSKKGHQCRICQQSVESANFFSHWETHLQISKDLVTVNCDGDPVDKGEAALDLGILITALAHLQQPTSEHTKSKSKVCVICKHRFERKDDCKRHVIEHLLLHAYAMKEKSQRELICQLCRKGFLKPEWYKQHMRDHAGLPVYKCEVCARTFSDSSNFTKHKKVHNLQVLICDICQSKFQAKSSLIKHMEMHKTMKPITCLICHNVFQLESTYKKHMRNFHEKKNIYVKCAICNMRFKCLKEKWDHLWVVHQERKHKADCPICDKSFRKFQDVKSHMKIDHEMELSILNMKWLNEAMDKGNSLVLGRTGVGIVDLNSSKMGDELETLIIYE